jgi:hypothetical protein
MFYSLLTLEKINILRIFGLVEARFKIFLAIIKAFFIKTGLVFFVIFNNIVKMPEY